MPEEVKKEATTAIEKLLGHEDTQVRELAALIKVSMERRKRIMELVQDALTQLRLDMKYLVFDLEATRRERDAAQKGN